MLEKSRGNAIAEVNVHVPEIYYFDRAKLLESASPATDPSLTILRPRHQIWAERARRKIGNASGKVMTAAMNGTTRLWGSIAGYRDRVWTNWYRRSITLGILTLAYMREQLNKKNLKTPILKERSLGFKNRARSLLPG